MADNDIRIVSLLPSATEIVAKLGLGDVIVGRSHECDYPPEIENRAICTESLLDTSASSVTLDAQVNKLWQSALSIYGIKVDVLEKLQPTHILTQDQCAVCAVSLSEVEQALAQLIHTSPQIISLQANSLGDVWADIERVSRIFGVDSVKLIENLEARVKICQQKISGFTCHEIPRVACIEWTDPLMTAGNWVPELINSAGGRSVFSSMGKKSALLDWETLIDSNPDVIIFMPCGLDLQQTQAEAEVFSRRPGWKKLHAVNTGRVYVTDGNAYFNRPSPRLVDSLEILAEILHPEIFKYGYQGRGWECLRIPSLVNAD